GVRTKEEDFTEHIFSASMLNYLLFFTEFGKLYWLKVYEVPEGNKGAKGRPIQNIINIEPGDKIRSVINVKTLNDDDYINNNYIIMCTAQGSIKIGRASCREREEISVGAGALRQKHTT